MWRRQKSQPRRPSHVDIAIAIAGHVAIAVVGRGANGCIAAGYGPVGKLDDQGLARRHLSKQPPMQSALHTARERHRLALILRLTSVRVEPKRGGSSVDSASHRMIQ